DTNLFVNMNYFFDLFVRLTGDLPPATGVPGGTGLNMEKFYGILEETSIFRKDLGVFPKRVAVNRVALNQACDRHGVLASEHANPFMNESFLIDHVPNFFS